MATKKAEIEGPFEGFSGDTLAFLAELAENNNKEWFEANRERWERALAAPARAFVRAVGPAICGWDPELVVDARVGGSIFRINRDVRFSKDKRPYKEELGFRFVPAGEEGASGLLMRIRPDFIGMAVGNWSFSPAQLARYRAGVDDPASGAAFAEMVAGLAHNGCGFAADPLKRVPAGFAADHPRAELLKARSVIVGVDRPIPDCFGQADFAAWCLAGWERLLPVHRWLRAVLG